MRVQPALLIGFVLAFGFASTAFAQGQASAPVTVDLTNKSPQIAALTGQFHVLDTAAAPVEIAPPGTIEDDSEISDNRAATDVPRRLQSAKIQ